MNQINIENLYFSYQKRSLASGYVMPMKCKNGQRKKLECVFSDFSYTFNPGLTMLRGYSGCGKSTLLRLMAGYLTQQQGRIKVLEHDYPNRHFQRCDLGFVFQGLNLLPNANVYQNLSLACALAGIPRREIREKIMHWLSAFGIEDLKHRKPKELSGGQQQRVAICRAFIKDTKVLLLDEPTSGLDDDNTAKILDAATKFVAQEKICIIASHDSRVIGRADVVLDLEKTHGCLVL